MPLVLGLIDAVRWARMSDRRFAVRYGFAGPAQSVGGAARNPIRRIVLSITWHAWKIGQTVSWFLAMLIIAASRGPTAQMVTAAAITLGLLMAARVVGNYISNPGIRRWIDPFGAEKAARICQPTQSPVVQVLLVVLSEIANQPRRRHRRWDDAFLPVRRWPTGDPIDEPPEFNPATGLLMSGPGTAGFDALGNAYGESHNHEHHRHD